MHETTINVDDSSRATPIYHEITRQFIAFGLNMGKGILPHAIYQYNNFYLFLASIPFLVYIITCCDMIAMKREVAT